MLTKLTLRNISKIEEAVIPLPQLLRIGGSNQAGKTSGLYRSIETMMLGESFPESMVRRGQKSGYMALDFSDGRKIEYRREGKKQSATLTYPENTTRHFDKIQGAEEEIRRFTGGIVFKPDKKSDKETPQFVPISASQVYMIQGMSDESILKKLTNLSGGSGIAVAKQRIESSLREKKGELKALEEIVCEARTEAEEALTYLEPLNDLKSRYEASRGQETAILEEEKSLGWLWEDYGTYGDLGRDLDGVDQESFQLLGNLIFSVSGEALSLERRENSLEGLRKTYAELLKLEAELDTDEVKMVDLEKQIAEEFERVPVCATCGRELNQ